MSSVVLERVSDIKAPSKEESAMKIVNRGIALSMGGGLIPVPLVDLVGIAGAQSQMIGQLSELYEVPYLEHRAKNIIATLIGSLGTGLLATGFVASIVKTVPFVGSMAGIVSLPIVACASTFALGKVFIYHFEAGGTLLDFDPEKTKEYFARQFADGKLVAGEMSAERSSSQNTKPSESPRSSPKAAENAPKPATGAKPSPTASGPGEGAKEEGVSSSSSASSSPSLSSVSDSPSPSASRGRSSRRRSKSRSGGKSGSET